MTAVEARQGKKLATELLPDRVLPKVLNTFGLTGAYVFIICWISGCSIMATGGWSAIPMWVAGILVFLIPAGLAVAELGNLWPAQGGVYIWAYRTMNEPLAFFGGFLSWIPVILNGATGPSVVLSFTLLALHATVGLAVSIILQLLILWLAVVLALRKLAATQRVMNVALVVYLAVAASVLLVGILHAARHGSATPVSAHDLFSLNFGKYGWIFGLVLLYLVGVETPFNMGAEFLSVRRSATRMILWGSIALSGIYVLGTVWTMLALPTAKINSITGVTSALKMGIPGMTEVASILIAVILVVALATYQSAYPQPGHRDPRAGLRGVHDDRRAVLTIQPDQCLPLPQRRTQRGLAVLRVLLLRAADHLAAPLQRPLQDRVVLADPRGAARCLSGRAGRLGRHGGRNLLLVHPSVRAEHQQGHLDDLGRPDLRGCARRGWAGLFLRPTVRE